MEKRRWVRVVGDGVAFSGPCFLHTIILHPNVATDHVRIYDGRDATTGKLFVQLQTKYDQTRCVNLGLGAPFDLGIFVDGEDADVETTVVFTPR